MVNSRRAPGCQRECARTFVPSAPLPYLHHDVLPLPWATRRTGATEWVLRAFASPQTPAAPHSPTQDGIVVVQLRARRRAPDGTEPLETGCGSTSPLLPGIGEEVAAGA